jgi:hypothetical protein
MIPLELMAVIGVGAVLPYVGEAAWDWLRHHKCPSGRSRARD